MRCPALLVAAPASGQGKTTVAAGLARLLARRGWRVRAFKCGPDYVDGGWLQAASGAPVHNLDLWMTGEPDVRARLHQAASSADAILIEGVMGLHDGEPSSAALARRLGIPVLAVVQAEAMAQTLGAVVLGLRGYGAGDVDPLPWAGVLANGVGSTGHAALLQSALQPGDGWLGHLPRDAALGLPERDAGVLATPEASADQALARLDAIADRLAPTPLGRLTLDDWRRRWSVRFPAPAAAPRLPTLLAGCTIAVAHDAAFACVYPANVETLQALGARVVCFSPLAGDALPDCDALWLPGGDAGRYAGRLAECVDLHAQLRAHARAGRPIWAEGGGLPLLLDELVDGAGASHRMSGVLPGSARVQPHLMGLGLQQWQPMAEVPALRGHAFHRVRVEAGLEPIGFTQVGVGANPRPGEAIRAVAGGRPVRGSLFQPWLASSPRLAAWLFGVGLDASTGAAGVCCHA